MEFPERADVDGLIDPQPLPEFARVRYEPRTERLDDPVGAARESLGALDLDGLSAGATVAVGVGSRGIDRIDEVAAGVVDRLDERGFDPVVVPAMGSHGGATPEGQREVLAALGVTEESVGAPIDARMAAAELATVSVGDAETPVYFAEAALEADAALVVNRVKAHTNFTGPIESGLAKMTVVGLGKQRGAKTFHSTAIAEGYVETLAAALDVIEEETPIVGGVALVENFEEEIGHVEGVPAGSFLDREPALLERAYEEMPTLPVDDVDLLVVDEIGKEISGAGMDTNVIGRYRVLNAPDPETPDIDLIYVRGLTEATKGNGNGIGLADLTRRAAVDQLDLTKSYANALTSGSLAKSKLPVVAPDDEFALRTAAAALGAYDPESARIVWIRNTQELGEFRVSDALIEDLPEAAVVTGRETVTFDAGTAGFEPASDGDADP
ncbi:MULTISPECIES: DUF362 domain-containing protein [Halorubrum]|uniref:DUF362 domain-containing protein n=1 Tax=Halorubrum tropicale TaxID=1765655 RepID=A0A0M9ASY2_9EURY|nr:MULTISPECIES: DUF362 domain-containing protein [Halorubrum]KOX98199.1 hypothetical protein AMR74_04720 [Halorubrum tropicale]TKX42700.1 DUF362 domain-containing protein [Halorubrum sp. ARQ200]TKX51398.1 DUF362 domain-containing protein [Halorubrum sp. ASP121]TKX58373.1 DUF362 domain-containing protein [Halorubrum sp. ASP1]